MVSIAESFYYRIFERKWRMGEALRGPSPCMPYSVSNKQKKKTRKEIFFSSLSVFFFQNKSPGSGEAGVFVLPARPFGLVFAVSRALFFVRARSLAARLAQPNKTFLKKRKKTLRFFLIFKKLKNLNILSIFVYRPEHGRTTRRT